MADNPVVTEDKRRTEGLCSMQFWVMRRGRTQVRVFGSAPAPTIQKPRATCNFAAKIIAEDRTVGNGTARPGALTRDGIHSHAANNLVFKAFASSHSAFSTCQ